MISSINDHILNSVQKGVGVGKQNGRNLSSTKNYKKKDYVSRTSGPRDPRTRKFRHMNTPERLTRGINVMHTPADWTVQTIESVFAGSGSIVKVDESRDPRTNKLIKYTVVYMDQQECSNAMRLLSRITPNPPFMYEMTLVPDNKYPLTPRVLDLKRTSFPYDKNINLPQEMLKRVPLEAAKSPSPQQQQQQQYSQGQQQKSQSSSSSNLPMAPPPAIVPIPDVLTKASSMLPPFVASRFCIHNAGIEKRVDENLGKVPIPQLIEIVSSLKNLVQSQQGINNNLLEQQLQQFLSGNQDVAVAVAQLLYEYDLINVDSIDALIKEGLDSRAQQVEKQQQQQQQFPPQQFPPQQMPQQQFPPQQMPQQQFPQQQFPQQQFPQQQFPQQQFPPHQMPPQQMPPQQHFPQQRMVKPTFTHRDKLNLKRKEIEHKLSKLTEQEATVIRQILEITPSQVVGLPAEQRQMIENIHKEYLDS